MYLAWSAAGDGRSQMGALVPVGINRADVWVDTPVEALGKLSWMPNISRFGHSYAMFWWFFYGLILKAISFDGFNLGATTFWFRKKRPLTSAPELDPRLGLRAFAAVWADHPCGTSDLGHIPHSALALVLLNLWALKCVSWSLEDLVMIIKADFVGKGWLLFKPSWAATAAVGRWRTWNSWIRRQLGLDVAEHKCWKTKVAVVVPFFPDSR